MQTEQSPTVKSTNLFGTKAETLEHLAPLLTKARVLPMVKFSVEQWNLAPEKIIGTINTCPWSTRPLIVRSSAASEDTQESSLAGHFQSVLNIKSENELREAIQTVIASYGSDADPASQVFVQPMVENVVLSGVAFSKDPNTGSPYAVVNYDDKSRDTTSVTSGSSNELRTLYCWKNRALTDDDDDVSSLIVPLILELERILDHDNLDIEFAIDESREVYLLQCRPLVVNIPTTDLHSLETSIKRVCTKIELLNRRHPYLLGSRTVFGVMPDWNPAEIIGLRPRPLALSLYQELITDNIWAYQRDNYGYRNLRSFPLLVSFGGLPYVDVRVDFNSFVPADLDSKLGERLVDLYIEKLISQPSHHDKVEFEVVYTCYTFDLPDRIRALESNGFSTNECEHLIESLRSLTNRIVRGKEGLWQRDADKIKRLEQRQPTIMNSDLDIVSKIYWLIEDCKRYGTLPFAGLARAGFIAVQMLRSLVTVGVLTQHEYDQFMSSLETVSGRMVRDFSVLSRKTFLDKYGHLRPGTYDILSPRYDEEPDRYFDWSSQRSSTDGLAEFRLSLEQYRQMEKLLFVHNLDLDVLGFFDFLKAAIEGREFSKFVFTKSLSEALNAFAQLGAEYGLNADDCSFANISCIKKMYNSSIDAGSTLLDSIAEGRKSFELTCQLRLPPLIVEPADVWKFEIAATEPSFITQMSVIAAVSILNETAELTDCIVFIPSADPGYDWIFSKGIKGLVTMFGGVNSHMAIRAGELKIPAIIGAGEVLYHQWARAKVLHIDCGNKQVWPLR